MSKIRPSTQLQQDGAVDGQAWKFDAASGLYVPFTPAANSGHTIQDEGAGLTQRANLNFKGAGVTAADDAANNATTVTIPAAGHTIQEEGASLATRSKLNFIGAGVTASDDAVNDATKITVTAVNPQTVRDNLTATGTEDRYVPNAGALPIDQSNPIVWKNDALLWPVEDYSYSGFTVVFPSALANGDKIKVWYLTAGTPVAGALVTPPPPVDPTKAIASVKGYATTNYAANAY